MSKYFEIHNFEQAYPFDEFAKIFKQFHEQAKANKVNGKSHGNRSVDFSTGAKLSTRYGQGAASRAPYINFSCVNIYWDTSMDKIRLAIALSNYGYYFEKSVITEYPELDDFQEVQDVILPGVGKGLAIQVQEFPEDAVDLRKLYTSFTRLCALFDKREIDSNSDRYVKFDRPLHLGDLVK